MKYITSLSNQDRKKLSLLYKNHDSYRVRQRSQAILLSDQGYCVNQIVQIVKLHRVTICSLIDAFEQNSFQALYDRSRSGRPPLFNENEQKIIIQKVKQYPQNIKTVTAQVNQQTNKSASVYTIKRVLKKRTKPGNRSRRPQQSKLTQS